VTRRGIVDSLITPLRIAPLYAKELSVRGSKGGKVGNESGTA